MVDDRKDDPLIFALDTSSRATSMALARGEHLLRSFRAEDDTVRSEKLWGEIESVFSMAGESVEDADLFSVCVGPGGFTGLRVGIAAVKGLAQAAGRPVVGVTSLEAVALAGWPAENVCAVVNSYKGEVCWQLFSFEGDGRPMARGEPAISRVDEVIERAREIEAILVAGDEVLGRAGDDEISLQIERAGLRIRQQAVTIAEQVARLAFMKYALGEIETPEGLRACYVRRAEAEVKLEMGLLGSKIRRNMRAADMMRASEEGHRVNKRTDG
jgi:tRNA threonylcarbamoyladenosine biosynthesis protein TsaB